jgi:hypothetical protein
VLSMRTAARFDSTVAGVALSSESADVVTPLPEIASGRSAVDLRHPMNHV